MPVRQVGRPFATYRGVMTSNGSSPDPDPRPRPRDEEAQEASSHRFARSAPLLGGLLFAVIGGVLVFLAIEFL